MSFWYIYLFIVGLISWLSSAFFGILIYRKNPADRTNQIFAIFCAATSMYGFFYMLVFSPVGNTRENSLLLFQLATVFTNFMAITFFHFVLLKLKLKRNLLIRIGYSLAFFFTAFTFSKLYIADVTAKGVFKYWADAGPLYSVYIAVTFLTSIYAMYIVIKRYFQSEETIEKKQMRLLFLGMSFSFVGATSNMFLWYRIYIPPLTAIFISGYVWFSAYSIVAYRFMDMKFVLKKSTAYAISLAIILLAALPIKLAFLNSNIVLNNLLDVLIIFLVLVFFPKIKDFSFRIAHRYFFSSIYVSQDVISKLSFQLRTTLDNGVIFEYIYQALKEALYLKNFSIISYNEQDNKYRFIFEKNLELPRDAELNINPDLFFDYIQKNKPIIIEELRRQDYLKHKELIDLLASCNIELLIPLNSKFKTIGLLGLGKKESGDTYDEEDLSLLEIISGFSATTLENSNLFNNLKKSKDDLESLLIMKRDFLRVVNHQLNTPVSIIRMSLASIKDDTMSADEGLPMIQAGLDRISHTLDDFWLAYEFEGQTLKIDQTETDLLPIINEELGKKRQLSLVNDRKLSLRLVTPDFPLPLVLGNKKFLSHVISILLDNAINYTPKGKIEISFLMEKKKGGNFLKTLISDSGVGISPEDRKIIYDKFSRGKTAQNLYPDGSGLGLYIAKKVIEAGGGELRLEKTELDKGSTFGLILKSFRPPASKLKEIKLKEENKARITEKAFPVKARKVLQAEPLKKIKAIFIEKDEQISEIYKIYLAKRGVDFYNCEDLKSALSLAVTLKPDIFLSDIIIPETKPDGTIDMLAEQGFTLLEEIKKDPELKDIPVIIFTSLDTENDRQKAKDLGAADYLVSSDISPEDLIGKIRDVVSNKG